ncbi:GH36-type glycosyl hydrolase domain-containing protein [Vreelandella alkaliphila]|uniref:GH36-type glycosyl hydrolase domain-containing protein n=1 Tax=Vreelandella alkaliphila TaxID=272774 RepID=UPI003BF5D452
MALWSSSAPVREELFSAERLEQHAGSLALAQVVTASPPKVASLTHRLNDNARVLLAAYRACAVTLAEGRDVVPAAAWLLDNYHLIEAQIREIRGDLPPGYYRQLPKLAEGPFAGYPRVFGIAWAFIAHTDSNIELANLRTFIKAYQRIQPLTIGELWAVAITLRIVLVENLRRLVDQIITEQTARDAADTLAAKWIATENGSPKRNDSSNHYSTYNDSINNESANSVSTDNCSMDEGSVDHQFPSFTSQKTPLSAPFIAQLAKRLRGVNPHTNALACWLFEQLNRQGESIDDVVQSTQQRQGAANVTVRNIITSMRFISSTDWAELFESVSLVDVKLREHSRFAQYDFSTRNQYRIAVEELARGSAYSELEVVDHTLTLSREALPLTDDVHEAARVEDPGYFLVAAGRHTLEERLNYRPPLKRRFRQLLLKNGINGYVIMLTATSVALVILAGWLLLSMHSGEVSSLWLWLLAALGVLPAVEIATSIVNRFVIYNIGAQPLPSLDLSKGVPPSLRTLVAMPTLLTNEADLKEQLDRLEVHHLGSDGGAISYALLTDGVDAQQAELATDEALLSICEKRIEELNKRYCPASHEKRFFLLHRNRVYNAGEQCWMGWERKRGKLHELNKLLRGATDTTFRDPPSLPRNVHYILTLDADTRLPRGAASKLVGKIAHPLNHPRFDPQQRRVVEGYAILQPRVTQSMPTGERGSIYQQLCSSPGGIDPYAAAISDLYQDLVGDGSFAGKGIYNIDAFEASLEGRIAENSLLSHDMFEGIFARAGLASDIEVIEDFPDRYDVVAKRQHRWVRGDWQLLPWLLTASLPPSGRLKILGNLRRSLLPPLLLACLAVSWQLPLMMAVVSSLMVIMIFSIPVLLSLITSFAPLRAGVNLRYHFQQWWDELTLGLKQILLQLMFLPDQAWRMLDAIVSTLIRVFITRRHLLEWTSSAQTMKCPHLTVWGFYRHMAPGTLLGVAIAFSALWFNSSVWLVVLPIALLWIAAPALATWLSSTASITTQPLIAEETALELRLIARRTWRYFETFVTTSTNLLPPDNFQEEPRPVIAQRTSPTNMGLYLLSILAARDFGWIGNPNALSRIETTLAVMHTLPRYRGHFFNWYAIDDLRPLNPRYVSTRDVAIAYPRAEEVKSTASQTINEAQTVRRLSTGVNGPPVTHLLSNGNYSVMLTATGGGYSRWHNLAITRWQPDTTRDHWGSVIFLRDTRRPSVWNATGQSLESHTSANNDDNHVLFAEDYARYVHRHESLASHLDILVSGEDDSEVRLLTLTNNGRQTCDIDVTVYAELVLTTPSTDNAHPSFAKMFVVTEYLPAFNALIATRRRRAPSEAQVWAAHFAVVEGDTVGDFQYETDREQFIGRGNRISTATALSEGQHLSGTVGSVIDPIFASHYCLRIAPGKAARIAYWTVVAGSREALMDLIDKHHDVSAFERAKMLAWTQAQVQLRHLGTQPEEAADFQRLAAPLLYPDACFRAPQKTIQSGAAQQSLLWQHGISGDLPIVLLRIESTDDLPQLHQLLRAHEYWRMKRLEVDIVIINERASSYIQDLQQAIEATILSSQARPRLHNGYAQGTVYALRADLASAQSRSQLLSIARVVLIAHRGSIADQLSVMLSGQSTAKPPLAITKRALPRPLIDKTHTLRQLKRPTLELFNGWGGFAKQGREYVTILEAGSSTPAPWINVIANQQFGFQVSAEGAGYLWADSSRENQLTPWSNDPVIDPSGDAVYVRDEETFELYTATASPIRDSGRYVARHGFGYSQFEHQNDELSLELLHFVPLDAPLRISRLRLTNHSNRTRKLSVTAYAEWVLGTSRSASAPFLITSQAPESGALLVTNPWNADFPGRVAFLDIGEPPTQWTGNRSEFIGYGKNLVEPAGLRCKTPLSGTLGAGLDPCAALQRPVTLAPGETVDIIVLLGQGGSNDDVTRLITRFRDADIDAELANIHDHWNTQLNAIQVKTPDRAMDIMLNGWLLYQTIACRLTARSAFYQASGAYGFRDQLQDCMALTFSNAATTRQHLLRAASRQFPEGDVQHWWLPHSGQGVRTRISDDRVWLAYACARYLATTQDIAVLDEPVSFLDGAQLSSHEHEHFYQPTTSLETAPLFEHCARGLDITLSQLGEHGLPLIGGGDWNDGMNRVGAGGKGESVWLGWLLLKTLHQFAPIAEQREAQACHSDDSQRAARWSHHAHALRLALENSAWDGQWYRRATYDNGSWLGSKQSDACQIDSIAQSWAVLSGASDPQRSTLAMHSLERELILHDQQLALLFWPPFNHPKQDPGYISGYPPGMRENGGQYSHASMWAILAFAQLGEGDKAYQLFTLLNPINHATTTEAAIRYRVEPYVVAADVYSVAPHVGRGGWTWYTGAAGWMYQAGMEGILGIRREASWLVIYPCLPASWPHFTADIIAQSHYHIKVINAQASPATLSQNLLSQPLLSQALTATLDDVCLAETEVGMPIRVPLDSQHHQLEIVIRRCAPAS